ncbi:MAG: zinc-ribbon domain-containing protein [Clostridia bacterium]|nr:zinc-ribbon domain-containing protein [Clostridia bacterium]
MEQLERIFIHSVKIRALFYRSICSYWEAELILKLFGDSWSCVFFSAAVPSAALFLPHKNDLIPKDGGVFMNCPNCGKEIENGVAFCKFCGSAVSMQNPGDNAQEETSDTRQEKKTTEEPSPNPLSNEFYSDGSKDAASETIADSKKQKSKSKKAIIPVTIALILVILAVIIGVTAEPKYEQLKVSYNGDTKADIVLNENNEGISVLGITKDGTEKEIKGWSVAEEKTLQEDSSATITITYKNISKDLTVKCSSSAVVDIYAEYKGSLSEGTTIDTSKKDVKVFAKHKNGKETEVTSDCVFDPASLTLKKDGSEIINVKYGDFAYNLELICSDKTIKEITAKYSGSTTAGTTINSSNVNMEVTAVYLDGTKEKVSGWKIETPVTLEADKESEVTITYKDQSCTIKVLCSTISDAAYKSKCESISYTELARSPKSYEGKNVKFTGTILQVIEDFEDGINYVALRVATKWGYSQYIDDVVYVLYAMPEDSPRFLEDDTITFYGVSTGLYTYKTVRGDEVTIPKVLAKVIELK